MTVYNLSSAPLSNRVTSLCEDRSGRIWAGTAGGLFLFDKNQDDAFHLFSFNLPGRSDTALAVFAIAEDSEGSIWLVTGSGLIRVLPDGRILAYEVFPLAMQIDNEGRLWLGSFWEMFIVKPTAAAEVNANDRFPWRSLSNQTKEVNKKAAELRLPTKPGEACRLETDERLADSSFGLSRSSLQSFCQTSDGHTWIGQQSVSKGGAGLTEFGGKGICRYTTRNGLSSDLIICVEEDSAGNLWAGTASNGVMKIARNGFISYKQNDGLSHVYINSIYEGDDRHLLVNSDHWFINLFDKERFKPVRANLPEAERLRGWSCYPTSSHLSLPRPCEAPVGRHQHRRRLSRG